MGKQDYIALDLPGHGKSEHRSVGAHYHLIDYVYDVHSVISELGFKNVVYIGHSLGGIIGCILASLQFKYLKGLVCIESAGPLTEPESTTVTQLQKCFASRENIIRPVKHPSSLEAVVRSRTMISDLSAQHSEMILSRNLEQSPQAIKWRSDRALRTTSPIRMTESQAIDILSNIVCKKQLILGNSGFEKLKKLKMQRQDLFRTWLYDECDGGHHVHMESPQQILPLVLKMLEEVSVQN